MSGVTISISEPLHLFEAQRATRMLSKAIGLDEIAILNAMTAVNELANHLFIRTEKSGKIDLSVVRRDDKVGLEVRSEASPVKLVFEKSC